MDELKTHLRGAKIVLRSNTPDLVRQEFYGLMMTHFAIRSLIDEAALRADEDPDLLSFLDAVRVVRRKLPAFSAIPPKHRNARHNSMLDEILQERVVCSRTRRNPRRQAQDEQPPASSPQRQAAAPAHYRASDHNT